MQFKAQSAIEFLSTYGFVFLIIGVAISILFSYISLPTTIVPAQCVFYSGFKCLTSSYNISSSGVGSNFTLIASDSNIGYLNITNFSVKIGNHVTNVGNCSNVSTFKTPADNISVGEKIYCHATFKNYTPTYGTSYSGTFLLNITECNQNLNNPNTTNYKSNCVSYMSITEGGSFRAQATKHIT